MPSTVKPVGPMLGLLFLSSTANAGDALQLKSESWCFASGLQVVLEPDPTRPEIAVRTIIEGGSSGETWDKAGLAHLVEHLWFRSHEDEDQPDVGEVAVGHGLFANAMTTKDTTTYMTTGPADQLKLMLELESRRLRTPLGHVDQTDLDAERSIVQNELRWRYLDSGGDYLAPLYARAFPAEHPYQHSLGGSDETLQSLTLDDVHAYAKEWYQPTHATIHITGDATGKQLQSILPEVFDKQLGANGQLMGECRTRKPAPFVDKPPGAFIEMKGAVDKPLGFVGWSFPTSERLLARYAFHRARYLLQESTSRSVDCGIIEARDGSLGVCTIELESTDDAKKLIKKGLRSLKYELGDRAYAARVHNIWRQNQTIDELWALDNGGSLSAVKWFHDTGRPDWVIAHIEELKKTSPMRAQGVFTNRFTEERAHIGVVYPGPAIEKSVNESHSSRGNNTDASNGWDEAFLASVIAEPDFKSAVTEQGANGLQITAVKHGHNGRARIALVFPRKTNDSLTDLVTWASLPDPSEVVHGRAFDQLGQIRQFRSDQAWTVQIEGLGVDKMMVILRDFVRTLKPTNELTRGLRKLTLQAPNAEQIANRTIGKEMLQKLYVSPEDTISKAASVTAKTRRDLAKRTLTAKGAHLIIIGDIDPKQVVSNAKFHLKDVKAGTGANVSSARAKVIPNPGRFYVKDTVKRSQSTIKMACRLGDNAMAANTIEAVTERLAGDILREELGLTYGVHSSVTRDQAGLRLTITTSVENQGVTKALDVLGKVTQQAAEPDKEALGLARLKVARDMADSLRYGDSVREELSELLLNDKNPAERDATLAKELMAIEPADLKTALAPCIGNEVTVVISGDETILRAVGGKQAY